MTARRSWITYTILLLVACAVVLIAKQSITNPMDARKQSLHSKIETIEAPAPYYMDTVKVDYAALQQTFTQRPKVWSQLVPDATAQNHIEAPPNFTAILKGVVPSKRKEMKVGKTLKVHVVSPLKPRGQWLGIGDEIYGCKIIAITPDHLVVEKYKGKNRYAHRYPRQ